MIAASNAAAPTVADQSSVLNLHSSVKAMSAAMAELRTAAAKVGFDWLINGYWKVLILLSILLAFVHG